MKRIKIVLALATLAALVASPLMAAGIPGTINLQGRFTDAAGNNVADGVYAVAFRIYDDPIAGNTLWSETLPVQVPGGLFTVLVGRTETIPKDLFVNINTDVTVQALLSRTITAPGAGYVLAIATAHVLIQHSTGSSNAIFGVSTTVGVLPANQDVSVVLPSTAPDGSYQQAVAVHGLFSTPGGSDIFYFLGDLVDGTFAIRDLQFTLIYFPTAHGIVEPTAAASGGEIISYQSADSPLQTVLPETGGEPVQGENIDQSVSKQELALMKAEMEARIQTLEEQLRPLQDLRQIQPGMEK